MQSKLTILPYAYSADAHIFYNLPTRPRTVFVSTLYARSAIRKREGQPDNPGSLPRNLRPLWRLNDKVSCGPTVWPLLTMSPFIEVAGEFLGRQLDRHVSGA